MQLLLEHGCDVAARDADGNTPLSWLCKDGASAASAAADWLVGRCGLEILHDVTTPQVMTQLRSSGVARFLVRHGADVNAPNDDDTPLRAAFVTKAQRVLLSSGAQPDGLVIGKDWRALCAFASCGVAVGADEWKVFLDQHCRLDAFLLLLMLDAVPRATAFCAPDAFVAACWWGLPIDDELLPATRTRTFAMKRREVAKEREAAQMDGAREVQEKLEAKVNHFR